MRDGKNIIQNGGGRQRDEIRFHQERVHVWRVRGVRDTSIGVLLDQKWSNFGSIYTQKFPRPYGPMKSRQGGGVVCYRYENNNYHVLYRGDFMTLVFLRSMWGQQTETMCFFVLYIFSVNIYYVNCFFPLVITLHFT